MAVPKRVTLPDGRSFAVRYERINRRDLPANVRMRRTYRQRAAPRNRRRRQRRRGIVSVAKKGISNPAFRAVAKKGLEYAPGLYKNLTKRIKNKKVQKILNSDLALLGLGQGIKAGHRLIDARPSKNLPPIGLDQKMGDGITNIQIENFFEKEENEDIRDNYVGVFSMDYITKFIKFHELIKDKGGKYPFAIFNTDAHNKPGMH